MKAYLLCWVDPDSLRVVDVGIFGEDPMTITRTDRTCPATLLESQGRNYAEARKHVLEMVRGSRSFAWCILGALQKLNKRRSAKMKQTRVILITHRRPTEGTAGCLEVLHKSGAEIQVARGYADLPQGHSTELTRAMDQLLERGADPQKHVVLSVDDDMHFRLSDAQAAVDYVRESGRAASGVYGTSEGRLAANRQSGVVWETGFGFLACRLDQLVKISQRHKRVGLSAYPAGIVPFSCSGIHPSIPDRWTGEDFWFSRELGGVDLLPLKIGHYKTFPLFPDDETLRKVAQGEALPTDDGPPVSQGDWSKRGAISSPHDS